jgi:hypothetical protein
MVYPRDPGWKAPDTSQAAAQAIIIAEAVTIIAQGGETVQ